MRKIFAMMMAAIVVVGCHNDVVVDEIPTMPNSYCGKLMLNVGEQTPRAFDSELKWQWESSDVIIGYQNTGEKSRNRLTLKTEGENSFTCEEFAYSTQDAADFHFFYANEETEGTLTAVQDGTWRPVLVGSVENTTLDEISTVAMEHLSAALEFNLYESDKETACNIASATLTSESDFVGSWSVDENLQYTQSLSGKSIELTKVNNSRVVFNMPVGNLSEITYTLTLTTVSGATITKNVPAQEFVAGQRNRYSIAMPEPAYLPTGYNFKTAIKKLSGYTAIKFVANSATTSETDIKLSETTQPIYLVMNDNTLEVHTPAPEFMANANCDYMFEQLSKLTSIDFGENFNTSNTTSMYGMFQKSSVLQEILNLNRFNTSNVTDMSSMFYYCQKLTSLDLSSFDTSKVIYMSYMFMMDSSTEQSNPSLLQSITFGEKFNTSNVVDMRQMFHNCHSLTSVDVRGFDTSDVTNMSHMFSCCRVLESLDLSNFNTSKVTDMQYMFYGNYKMESIIFGENFNTSNVTKMIWMFYSCFNLAELDLTMFDFSNSPSVGNIFNYIGYKLPTGQTTTIYVTTEGYNYLTDNKSLGTDGKYTLTIKDN